jgi:hypothetical protein
MQIFALDDDAGKAAKALSDKHVPKMVLETAQILSTVASTQGLVTRYRPTHVSHPCVIWAGACSANTSWLLAYGRELGREYTFRFKKTHASASVIEELALALESMAVDGVPRTPFTTKSLLPDYQGLFPSVYAHRVSYMREKSHLLAYARGRLPPSWLVFNQPREGLLQ